MKLNKKDIDVLVNLGYTLSDIKQIQKLIYKFTLLDEYENETRISLEIAKEKLSQNDFLSGIGRAAFHRTSFRTINDTKYKGVLIESNLV